MTDTPRVVDYHRQLRDVRWVLTEKANRGGCQEVENAIMAAWLLKVFKFSWAWSLCHILEAGKGEKKKQGSSLTWCPDPRLPSLSFLASHSWTSKLCTAIIKKSKRILGTFCCRLGDFAMVQRFK
jgi:hypothetical protein